MRPQTGEWLSPSLSLMYVTSLNCIGAIGQLVVACVRPIDAVPNAFRTGEGVPSLSPEAPFGRLHR